jgi:HEAT repeat protein
MVRLVEDRQCSNATDPDAPRQVPAAIDLLKESAQRQAEVVSEMIERLEPVRGALDENGAPGLQGDPDLVPVAKELIEAAKMFEGNTKLIAAAIEALEI